ncbi:MAG: choice-of-anchor D domain-containing protein, partial [Cyclobacteriaceae bacterium]|nr:choice-of-anchor D domain-containing protein [Cyclobacteriaceae bacterium]
SADLPVQFVSSDVSVATINGNIVSIVGAGTTTITASQPGNDSFQAAPGVARELVVQKANQIITFALPASANFTSNGLSLQATSSAGLVVNFSSSANSIANITGNALAFVTPGTVQITASQAGNTNYNAASNVVLPLTIIDDRQNISLTGALDFGNVLLGETATKTMTITNTGNAVLQISAITLPQGFSSAVGPTTVNANASITVQITFAPSELKDYEGSVVISSNAVSGSNSLALSGTGVTITGFNEPGQSSGDLDVYPNPGTGVYLVKSKMTRDKSIAIMDMSGRAQYRILKSIDEQHHQLDIVDLPQGIYYLKIEEKGSVAVKRIVKLN